MKILVTGAKGFIGKNLVASLASIRDGKDRTRPGLTVDAIYEVGRDTSREQLKVWAQEADFVVHLAGVNRPKEEQEFAEGNVNFSREVRDLLMQVGSAAPVWVSSSLQATLEGRFAGSVYGQSKRDGENVWRAYTGGPVYLYRLPNVFGKWCRPNYNSAVATFCYNIARDLPVMVTDPSIALDLVYVDDVVREILDAMEGRAHRAAELGYYEVPETHHVTLGEIVSLLEQFHTQPVTLVMPSIPEGSFAKALYSTYLSYLPSSRVSQVLTMHTDARGSFTEVLKTSSHGQVSVNISKPGITKGEHWHHSKWEIFLVVSGEGIIQQRRIGVDEAGQPYPVIESRVSGERLEAVYILPGYTHNIINVSDTQDLVTLMWVNEPFDPAHPETYFELVNKEDA